MLCEVGEAFSFIAQAPNFVLSFEDVLLFFAVQTPPVAHAHSDLQARNNSYTYSKSVKLSVNRKPATSVHRPKFGKEVGKAR